METELLPSFHFVRPIACLSFDGRRKVLADPPEYSVRLAVPGRRQPLGFLRAPLAKPRLHCSWQVFLLVLFIFIRGCNKTCYHTKGVK